MLRVPLMTVHEVADMLKVTEETVRTWIRHKDLRAIELGKNWRIAVADLQAYLDAHANF